MRVSAFAATVLALFSTVPGGNSQAIPEGFALIVLVLWLAAAAVRTWIHVEGQAALNAYWRSVPNDNPRARVAWWERSLLVLGVIWFVLIVYGLLPPNDLLAGRRDWAGRRAGTTPTVRRPGRRPRATARSRRGRRRRAAGARA